MIVNELRKYFWLNDISKIQNFYEFQKIKAKL
jgi:hypothetical protein